MALQKGPLKVPPAEGLLVAQGVHQQVLQALHLVVRPVHLQVTQPRVPRGVVLHLVHQPVLPVHLQAVLRKALPVEVLRAVLPPKFQKKKSSKRSFPTMVPMRLVMRATLVMPMLVTKILRMRSLMRSMRLMRMMMTMMTPMPTPMTLMTPMLTPMPPMTLIRMLLRLR